MHHPDVLRQVAAERGKDLRAAAAARRLAAPEPARTRIARALRRTADRLDPCTPTNRVGPALPGC